MDTKALADYYVFFVDKKHVVWYYYVFFVDKRQASLVLLRVFCGQKTREYGNTKLRTVFFVHKRHCNNTKLRTVPGIIATCFLWTKGTVIIPNSEQCFLWIKNTVLSYYYHKIYWPEFGNYVFFVDKRHCSEFGIPNSGQ